MREEATVPLQEKPGELVDISRQGIIRLISEKSSTDDYGWILGTRMNIKSLYNLLSEKRNLSEKEAESIAKRLGLDGREKEIFLKAMEDGGVVISRIEAGELFSSLETLNESRMEHKIPVPIPQISIGEENEEALPKIIQPDKDPETEKEEETRNASSLLLPEQSSKPKIFQVEEKRNAKTNFVGNVAKERPKDIFQHRTLTESELEEIFSSNDNWKAVTRAIIRKSMANIKKLSLKLGKPPLYLQSACTEGRAVVLDQEVLERLMRELKMPEIYLEKYREMWKKLKLSKETKQGKTSPRTEEIKKEIRVNKPEIKIDLPLDVSDEVVYLQVVDSVFNLIIGGNGGGLKSIKEKSVKIIGDTLFVSIKGSGVKIPKVKSQNKLTKVYFLASFSQGE